MQIRTAITIVESTMADPLEQLMTSVSTELGVTMEIFDGDNGLVLADIQRGGGEPGAGKIALQRLCAYADARHQPIMLAILDYEQKLVQLYQQFGFVMYDPEHEEDGGMHMVRPAQP